MEREYKNQEKTAEKKLLVSDVLYKREFTDFGTVTYTEKTRAVIKVQDGCDRYCSYCIIPYARGRVRSRKPESIIKEIKDIAKLGIKEVVITGIHIASYGKDFTKEDILEINNKFNFNKKEYKLIDLLENINEIKNIERIRLRFNRTNINYKRFCKKTSKIRKNM